MMKLQCVTSFLKMLPKSFRTELGEKAWTRLEVTPGWMTVGGKTAR